MSETVHVKVIKGSISTWEDGDFKKDDVFETTREKALQIDPSFIQILEDLPPVETAEPEQPTEEPVEEEQEPTVTVEEVLEEESTLKKKRKKVAKNAS